MESTVNDFWRMIWEHKSRVLVMLCGLKEDGKVNQYYFKCWFTQDIHNQSGELPSVLARSCGLISSVWKVQGQTHSWRKEWRVHNSQVSNRRRHPIPDTSECDKSYFCVLSIILCMVDTQLGYTWWCGHHTVSPHSVAKSNYCTNHSINLKIDW